MRRQFDSAQPFRHLVVDNFLDAAYCRQLIAGFPAFDKKRALNEYGEVGGKAVFQNLAELGPPYQQFDQIMRSPEFLLFVGEMTGIPNLLYDPAYVGGGTHENLSGQELDPHVDFNYHPATRLHRRLNLILFLNPEWREEWGGCLELHRNPWLPAGQNQIKTVLPVENRCVLFETSEISWHGFSKVQAPNGRDVSRRSIAVYFYTKERPPGETAPDHATIYVQRPLPPHIKPGHTLEPGDVDAIQDLLTRRDQQLKFLYEREKKYTATLNSIIESPAFRLVRLLTWPLRMLRNISRGRGK